MNRTKVPPGLDKPHSHLVCVAGSGLRSGGLGLVGDNGVVIKMLEDSLENGAMSDLSTLKMKRDKLVLVPTLI